MRNEPKLTEKDIRNQERLRREIAEDRKNKKIKITKGHVAWWFNFIGFICLFWLLYDVGHIGEYSDFGKAVEFALYKFIGAIIFMGVAYIIQDENTKNN